MQLRQSPEWRNIRLLLIWLSAVFVMACILPSHPAARYSIYAAPPLIFLALRDIKRSLPRRIHGTVTAALLVSTAWLGLNLTWADWKFPQCSDSLISRAWEDFGLSARRVYTTGHWGVQESVLKLGGNIHDIKRTRLEAGDVILAPLATNRHDWPQFRQVSLRGLGQIWCNPLPTGLRTIQPQIGACFYGGMVWLPYCFVYGLPDDYAILEKLLVFEVTDSHAAE